MTYHVTISKTKSYIVSDKKDGPVEEDEGSFIKRYSGSYLKEIDRVMPMFKMWRNVSGLRMETRRFVQEVWMKDNDSWNF
jgi:hypothetical protein